MQESGPGDEQSRDKLIRPDSPEPSTGTAFEKAYPGTIAQGEEAMEAQKPEGADERPAAMSGSDAAMPAVGNMPLRQEEHELLEFEGREPDYDERSRVRRIMDGGKSTIGSAMSKAGVTVRRTTENIWERRYDYTPTQEAAAAGVTALAIRGAIKWVRGLHRGDRSYTPHMPNLPHTAKARRNMANVMKHLPDRISKK